MTDAPSSPAVKPAVPQIPLSRILPVISSILRCEILRELMKGQALPVCEIAARLRASESATSKHMAVLLASGLVRRHYGLYAIDSRFVVPGEHSLEFGSVLIRLGTIA